MKFFILITFQAAKLISDVNQYENLVIAKAVFLILIACHEGCEIPLYRSIIYYNLAPLVSYPHPCRGPVLIHFKTLKLSSAGG